MPGNPTSIPLDRAPDAPGGKDPPDLPLDGAEPVFRAPWEAQAFAIALSLHERGVFTWGEWTEALSEAIKRAQLSGDPDRGDTYYQYWLAALEQLVTAKGIAGSEALRRYRDAWSRAADRTPHGMPIELNRQDFGDQE